MCLIPVGQLGHHIPLTPQFESSLATVNSYELQLRLVKAEEIQLPFQVSKMIIYFIYLIDVCCNIMYLISRNLFM